MDLCFSCQRFDIRRLARSPGGKGRYWLKLAQDGARSGCSFCTILVNTIFERVSEVCDEEKMWIHFEAMKSRQSATGSNQNSGSLDIDRLRVFIAPETYLIDDEEVVEKSLTELHVCADQGSAAATSQAISGRYLGQDPRSAENIQAVKEWLNECNGHARCCQTLSGNQKLDAKDAPLPSRCIDVRGELLILRETAGKTGSYMTLSHRWDAETESSRTTVDNYEDRKRGFSLDDLSKTFKDFVWVARQLDMAYVWIDSICIIQGDDSQDWTQEAGKMAEYYQRSLLTIAATSSSQEEGLFPFQPPIFERRLARLPYRDEDGVQRGYFYVYPVASINGEYESHVRGSALLRRGWVFQEWLLSRRVICFTRSGIFFECQTELPRNGHREMLKVPNKKKDRKEVELTLKAVFSFDKERPEDLWWDVVEAFSVHELTFPAKDRLLALSGIAAEFSEATKRKTAVKGRREGRDGLAHVDVYASGLWLNDITRGFLWQQKGSPGGCQRASGMPTWSWTSLLGPVTWAGIKGSPPATKAIEVLGLLTPDGAAYPAPPPDTSPELPSPADVIAPTHSAPVVESYYGVSSSFTGLLVKGRISAILAWDLYTSRNLDEMSIPVIGANNGEAYRKIASHVRPRDICGWGSFEHTDFQTQLAFWDGQTTYALHISTSKPGKGLLCRGLLGSGGSTYNVVFVRKVGGSKYNRVGVGVLWGKEVMAEFSSLEPQVLELV